MTQPPEQPRYFVTIVAAILALVLIFAFVAVALSLVGASSTSTPVLATLGAIITPTVISLLALLRIDALGHQVNGRLTKVEQTVGAEPGEAGEHGS